MFGSAPGRGIFLIFTRKGQVIRFRETDVRETGRAARGVRGLRLKESDVVVSMESVFPGEREGAGEGEAPAKTPALEAVPSEKPASPSPSDGANKETEILVVTEKRLRKKSSPLSIQSSKKRRPGGAGTKSYGENRRGDCAGLRPAGGRPSSPPIKASPSDFLWRMCLFFGRLSQGVRFINLKPGETVTGADLVDEDSEEE